MLSVVTTETKKQTKKWDTRKLSKVMDIFSTLFAVMVTHMYTYVQIIQVIYIMCRYLYLPTIPQESCNKSGTQLRNYGAPLLLGSWI